MLFYPVIFTRTGNPKGTDFQYWAGLPHKAHKHEDKLDKILMQTINEDMFPKMKRPRRMYFRSKEFVFWRFTSNEFIFWGLALHNKDFVSGDILESLRDRWEKQRCSESEIKANTAQIQNVRGFWGGFVDLTDVPKDGRNDLTKLIASSLIRSSTDLLLDEDRKKKLDQYASADPRRPKQFIGKSPFPFAARMFQHFVMPWWNSNLNVSREPYYANAPASQPFLSTSQYDLSCFISPVNTKESDKTKAYLDDMEKHRGKKKKKQNICAYVEDDDIVEKDLIRLIKSGEEELHLGPVEIVSHARIIAEKIPKTNVVFINDAGGSHRDKRFHELSKKGKKNEMMAIKSNK